MFYMLFNQWVDNAKASNILFKSVFYHLCSSLPAILLKKLQTIDFFGIKNFTKILSKLAYLLTYIPCKFYFSPNSTFTLIKMLYF